MSFLKLAFFIIAFVTITTSKAQDMEQMGESSSESIAEASSEETTERMTLLLEEVNPNDSSNEESVHELEVLQTSTESSNEPIAEASSEERTESPNESMAEASSEETTERMTLLLEEVNSNDSLNEESVHALEVLQTSTESDELISSEYNGFDENQMGSEFSCFGRSFGQYADVAKGCRLFHLCYPFFNSTTTELLYQRVTFMCDDDSVFDQKRFICVDNSTIEHKCSDSEALYNTTNQEYLIRVFSQSVSPIDEVKGQSEQEVKPSASPSWFNWLYNN